MYHPTKFYTKGLGGYKPLTMCFIVVASPSSSIDWGFNYCVYYDCI